jgi:hypothetical protein
MFDGHRSLERVLFFVLALGRLPLRGQAPTTTTVSEGLFGGHSVTEKNTALSFMQATLSMANAYLPTCCSKNLSTLLT